MTPAAIDELLNKLQEAEDACDLGIEFVDNKAMRSIVAQWAAGLPTSRCQWFGEGRGQCLLCEGHKGHHTCEEDGRHLDIAMTGLAAAREQWQRVEAQWAAGQSQWRDVATDPPVEWLEVLAYRPGLNTTYFLAQRFTHSSGNIHWEMNRRVDPSAAPPTKWMLLPKEPS